MEAVPREWIRVSLNGSGGGAAGDAWSNFSGLDLVLHQYHRERLTLANLHNLVLVALYVATFAVATSANTVALIVFWRFPHLRRLSNSLLITLAVSDLLVSLVCMPMAIGFYTYRLWVFGEAMCKLANYLQGVSVSASVFTMTVMSVDRYVVICHPIAFRRLACRRHVAAWGIAIVWALALLLFAPVLHVRRASGVVLHDGVGREVSFVYCVESWATPRAREAFASATFGLVFVVPGATMAAAYCRIGVRLCGGGRGLHRTAAAVSTQERSRHHQTVSFRVRSIVERRRLVAKRFLILTTVFAVCWVPYNIATLLLDFGVGGDALSSFLPFGLLLGHVNSAVNPLLYCWVNRRFRECVAATFTCRRRVQRQAAPLQDQYPMTVAASLRSSSLVWRRSLRRAESGLRTPDTHSDK